MEPNIADTETKVRLAATQTVAGKTFYRSPIGQIHYPLCPVLQSLDLSCFVTRRTAFRSGAKWCEVCFPHYSIRAHQTLGYRAIRTGKRATKKELYLAQCQICHSSHSKETRRNNKKKPQPGRGYLPNIVSDMSRQVRHLTNIISDMRLEKSAKRRYRSRSRSLDSSFDSRDYALPYSDDYSY
jgi:hypothetical protein